MELDARKRKILNAIIKNYQETGEPVGSRTISKMEELKLSPATIRNEMADLEELGLIVQPHTSAGRVPTDKAYRLYVDQMMAAHGREAQPDDEEALQLPAATSQDMLLKRVDRVEELLMQMARILAANTNYTTMISGPHYKTNKLKFIQLSSMGGGRLLAVIVLEGNIVKNNILDIGDDISADEILSLNFLLNNNLNGLALEEINLGVIARMKEEAGAHGDIVTKILDAVAATFEQEAVPIYTSGATNIFKYPELTGGDKASELISTLEEKERLGNIIAVAPADGESKQDIQVYIGDEVPVDSMKDCSVVTATYELGEGIQGKIGIIGPKRMDYRKVVETLKGTMSQLDDIFKK